MIEIVILILIKLIKKNKEKKIIIKKYNKNKGEYLTILGNCITCHTLNGGKPFVGGVSTKTSFGIINSPNITQSKKYGIGKVKLKEFINIIKLGISKKKILFPIFPYINYSGIKKQEIKNIFLFLKTIKNEEIINKKNKIKFPIKYRNIMIGWRALFFNKTKKSKNKIKSNIKRGNYIVKTLGHCVMCHTKINSIGRVNNNFKYVGKSIIEKWTSVNISNKNSNIRKSRVSEIWKILKEGVSKNKNITTQMSEIINNSLQYVNKIDIFSISKFIKNKINKNKIIEEKKNFKKIKKIYTKMKHIYKKECKNCHGKFSLGKYPVYPKLIKINKKIEINNIKQIFKKIDLINTIKNKYPAVMPIFKKIKNKNTEKYISIIQN